MLRLRPYTPSDASTILSWTKDETTFYQWTAGVLGDEWRCLELEIQL